MPGGRHGVVGRRIPLQKQSRVFLQERFDGLRELGFLPLVRVVLQESPVVDEGTKLLQLFRCWAL